MTIKDSSYAKMVKEKKYKDLFDLTSLECRVAFWGMIIINIIFIICSIGIGADEAIGVGIEISCNIGVALIGLLGFTVSALAVLTGSISSKVVKILQDRYKFQTLERILLSFYLLGIVCAFDILLILVIYFLAQLPVDSILVINIFFVSVISYFTIFLIFYSVKLIGNCLELFYIVSNFELLGDKKIDFKTKYNNYRIAALEKVLLSETSFEKVREYRDTIGELIKRDTCSDEEKELLFKMHDEQFRN